MRSNTSSDSNLTPKQLVLLQALADGDTIGMAAKTAGTTYYYAKSVMKDLRDRIGADTTAQAVAMGIRRGLIT